MRLRESSFIKILIYRLVIFFFLFLFQINLILVKYNQAKLFSHFHNFTIVLVSLNSTLNPFIYALWGRQFRPGIKAGLCRCFGRKTKSDVTLNSGQEGSYELSFVSGQNNISLETSSL